MDRIVIVLPIESCSIRTSGDLDRRGRHLKVLRSEVIRNSGKQEDLAETRRHGFEAEQRVCGAARELFLMSRPINLVPSLLLSLAGSWMTASYDPGVLLMPPVWTTSACSALIAAASMLVNDCYDHRSGTDEFNQRNSALRNGAIDMADVGLVAGCIYGGVMLATSCLEQPQARLLITISAWITYIYTPLLKKLMLVKNIAVAGVIASSVIAGGLAVVGHGLNAIPWRALASSVYLFLSILSREIVMDVKDVAGDKAAGIRTIPVCLGEKAGRVAAAIFAAAANVFVVQAVWIRSKSWYGSAVLSGLNCGMFACILRKLAAFSRDGLECLIGRDFLVALALGVVTMAIAL